MRLAAVLAGAVLAACGSDVPSALPASSPAVADAEAAVLAAVDVQAAGCGPALDLGAGSVVAEGLVVTAAHVVAGTDEIEVTDTRGNTASATVVLFDPDNDVAALRTERPLGTPLRPRTDTAKEGEVGVLVAPRAVDDEVRIEVVDLLVLRPVRINTTDIYRETDVTRDGFELDADVLEGDSGAMVVLPGGGVGVLWAKSNQREGVAWGVDLPAELADPAALTDPVDNGRCDD